MRVPVNAGYGKEITTKRGTRRQNFTSERILACHDNRAFLFFNQCHVIYWKVYLYYCIDIYLNHYLSTLIYCIEIFFPNEWKRSLDREPNGETLTFKVNTSPKVVLADNCSASSHSEHNWNTHLLFSSVCCKEIILNSTEYHLFVFVL